MEIKFCGITRKEDALYASSLGVWGVGFVFYPKSPRYIKPEEAGEIIKLLPKEIKKIGVFVNASKEEMLEIKKTSGIDTFQLHGEESPELCESLESPIIKAFRLKSADDLEVVRTYTELKNLYAFLIDAFSEKAYGGTGLKADWSLAKEVGQYGKVILAGGINSDNVKEAIREVNPYAVDLSSSIEIVPGIKDYYKIKEFFDTVYFS